MPLAGAVSDRLENIDVVVEDFPSRYDMRQVLNPSKGYTLLGLYEGVPLLRRNSYYGMVTPDKITIFQRVIESQYGSDDFAIAKRNREVVRHEHSPTISAFRMPATNFEGRGPKLSRSIFLVSTCAMNYNSLRYTI